MEFYKMLVVSALVILVCPPVLIVPSIAANLEKSSEISSTIRNKEVQTKPTMLFINNVTSEARPEVSDAQYIETTRTEPNTYENNSYKSNIKETTYVMDKQNHSISAGNVSKTIITYRDFKEYEYYKDLSKIYPYASNIPGIITNVLTIIIAANINPLHTSEIYMIVLGSADFTVVVTRCSYTLWTFYSDTSTVVSCKVPRYINHVATIYSNMTLLAWTFERFIAVIFPIQLASMCSIRNTKITLAMLLLLCLLLGIPYLTEYEAFSFVNGKELITVCVQSNFFRAVWTYFESFYYIYIPMVCVCTCNLAILCRLSSMAKSRIHMTSNQEIIDKNAKENRRITILLLTISGSFLVLHIPFAMNSVFTYFHPDSTILITNDPQFFARFLFYLTLGFMITEYQNSVNFFLYCISGNKFRATFKKLFVKAS